jgi:hypothetical protein
LALTGRLALPADYATHRHNGDPNPRLESPESHMQRGLTRVDRERHAALGTVENAPISRVAFAMESDGKRWKAMDMPVIGARPEMHDNGTAEGTLLQQKRGLCVVHAR